MKTIRNLRKLLKNMRPVLQPEKYFICVASRPMGIGTFKEKEGMTVFISESELKNKTTRPKIKKKSGPYALITLNVYSDLNAIGFLAAITRALADKKISMNAVSAFHHDHLFVPWKKRREAMETLHSQILAKTR